VRARRMAWRDNRSSEVGLSWDIDQLLADVTAGVDLSGVFRDDEIEELLAGVQEAEAPPDFPEYDESLETDYHCPKCGYEWSGAAK